MNEELVEIYNCGCRPEYNYKTKSTYKNHMKSDRHKQWQVQNENQHLRKTITTLQNELSSLKLERNVWRNQTLEMKRKYEPPNDLLD